VRIVFQLHDVLGFDSTLVINVLINTSSPKLNDQIFNILKYKVHEYVFQLTSTPKVELLGSCKLRKFIGQNKVKICKL